MLDIYLTRHPDSIVAINLKACNRFRLFDGRAAESLIRNMVSDRHASASAVDRLGGGVGGVGGTAIGATGVGHVNADDDDDDGTGAFGRELLRHNLVVFRGGEGALQVLPGLLDIVPEARLNLAIYYLRGGDVERAEQLICDVQPSVSYEYVLKGAVHAALAQQLGSVCFTRMSSYTKLGPTGNVLKTFPEGAPEERPAVLALGRRQCGRVRHDTRTPEHGVRVLSVRPV